MAKKAKSPAPPVPEANPPVPGFGPELIVIARPDAQLRANPAGVHSASALDVSSLTTLLQREGIALTPLFGVSEARISEKQARTPGLDDGPDLSVFYKAEVTAGRLEEAAAQLRANEFVEAAYVKPATELPFLRSTEPISVSTNVPPPPVTPDFSTRQGYLDAAPGGIDARFAWTQAGGRGTGVRVIDIEGNWQFSHEDLVQNQGGLVGGTLHPGLDWRDHGTAVFGEIGGDHNGHGILGISPDAVTSAVSHGTIGSAQAIRQAADRLGPGDILLLEMHRPGPRFNYQQRNDQRGYIAVEWWPDDFAAIRYAVGRGVLVVEAAGNGAENLDDVLYNTAGPGFPGGWTNPFNRANRDAGAIVVGAGAPPPGTHGANHGPDRSRLDFSNFGACVDAQGWGREVTTTGYGGLQGGPGSAVPETEWYTDRFSGTSSASPIVVGALACVQGILRARGRIVLSPARARELLRATGSPQQDAPGRPATQRIGNRPNLRQLITSATQAVTPWVGVQFRGTLQAHQSGQWFTFNWPAHWHVIWTVMPLTVRTGAPQVKLKVRVERASDRFVTYWLQVTNLTNAPVEFEGRYGVLGW
jgi:hypothetical protein